MLTLRENHYLKFRQNLFVRIIYFKNRSIRRGEGSDTLSRPYTNDPFNLRVTVWVHSSLSGDVRWMLWRVVLKGWRIVKLWNSSHIRSVISSDKYHHRLQYRIFNILYYKKFPKTEDILYERLGFIPHFYIYKPLPVRLQQIFL